MSSAKISATLDSATLTAIRARTGARGVSAWLDAAAREKLERDGRRERLLEVLAELDRADPVSQAERAEADRRLTEALGALP